MATGHGVRIEDLYNPESPEGTPVLAFASHQLAPGDRNYREMTTPAQRVRSRRPRRLAIMKRQLEKTTRFAFHQRTARVVYGPSPSGGATYQADTKSKTPLSPSQTTTHTGSEPESQLSLSPVKTPSPRRIVSPTVIDLSSSKQTSVPSQSATCTSNTNVPCETGNTKPPETPSPRRIAPPTVIDLSDSGRTSIPSTPATSTQNITAPRGSGSMSPPASEAVR